MIPADLFRDKAAGISSIHLLPTSTFHTLQTSQTRDAATPLAEASSRAPRGWRDGRAASRCLHKTWSSLATAKKVRRPWREHETNVPPHTVRLCKIDFSLHHLSARESTAVHGAYGDAVPCGQGYLVTALKYCGKASKACAYNAKPHQREFAMEDFHTFLLTICWDYFFQSTRS